MRLARTSVIAYVGKAARALPRIRARIVKTGHKTAQNHVDKVIPPTDLQSVRPGLFVPSAPIHYTRVHPQPFYLVFNLTGYEADKLRVIFRDVCAGEHHILPDHDSFFVTKIVESIAFVDSATPYAQHIEICFCSFGNKIIVFFYVDRPDKAFRRHPIRPFYKNLLPVYDEFISRNIFPDRFLQEFYFPKSQSSSPLINDLSVPYKFHLIGVQRLRTFPRRIPQPRIVDAKVLKIFLPFYSALERFPL